MNESYYYWQCPLCHAETYNQIQKHDHIMSTKDDEKHRFRDSFQRYHIETQRI